MKAPLLIATALLTAALLMAAAACDDEDEDLPADAEPTTTIAPTVSAPPSHTTVATVSLPPAESKTPVPIPDDWEEYENGDMGFSISYSPDFTANVVGDGTPQGEMGERVVEFTVHGNPSRGALAVSTLEKNPRGLTLGQLAEEFYCFSVKQEYLLAGERAIRCLRAYPDPDPPAPVIIAEHGDEFYVVQASPRVSDEEFEAAIHSFKFIE